MENQQISNILRSFRHYVTRRGGFSKDNLEKIFQEIDCVLDDDMLQTDELLRRMTAIGIEITSYEAALVKKHFDHDSSGTVSLDEFFRAMQPPLNRIRGRLVRRAFNLLKDHKKGEAAIDKVKERCLIQFHPDVAANKVAPQAKVVSMLREMGGSDGWISEEDFYAFAKTLSYCYSDDDKFGLCFSKMWQISFIPSYSLKKCQKLIKRTVCVKTGQSEDEAVQTIHTVFHKYDHNNNGTLELDEFRRFINDLGIELSDLELQAIFENYDTDDNGTVDMHEFVAGVSQVKAFHTARTTDKPEADAQKDIPVVHHHRHHSRRQSSAEIIVETQDTARKPRNASKSRDAENNRSQNRGSSSDSSDDRKQKKDRSRDKDRKEANRDIKRSVSRGTESSKKSKEKGGIRGHSRSRSEIPRRSKD